jgi:hypothetical protein
MISFYLIPMTEPPYDRVNNQRPEYLNEIQANWTGYPLDSFSYYVCKVNTTLTKHTDLESRQGVWRFPPDGLETIINALHPSEQNRISQLCGNIGIPYYSDETLRSLLQRVIVTDVLDWGNNDRYTSLENMPGNSQSRTSNLFGKWGLSYTSTDTLEQLQAICGDTFWNPDTLYVEEF